MIPRRLVPALFVTVMVIACAPVARAQDAASLQKQRGELPPADPLTEVTSAFVRLPVAALLGAGLALRPKRRGTPSRQPAVIQTQIILAIVGAVVMMVVGTNLARAFGVVGRGRPRALPCEDRGSQGRRRHALHAGRRPGLRGRPLCDGGVLRRVHSRGPLDHRIVRAAEPQDCSSSR